MTWSVWQAASVYGPKRGLVTEREGFTAQAASTENPQTGRFLLTPCSERPALIPLVNPQTLSNWAAPPLQKLCWIPPKQWNMYRMASFALAGTVEWHKCLEKVLD